MKLHAAVLLFIHFVLSQAGADIFNHCLMICNSDAQMTGAAKDGAVSIAVFGGPVRIETPPEPRLGDFLVNDAVQFLPSEEVIVAVETPSPATRRASRRSARKVVAP